MFNSKKLEIFWGSNQPSILVTGTVCQLEKREAQKFGGNIASAELDLSKLNVHYVGGLNNNRTPDVTVRHWENLRGSTQRDSAPVQIEICTKKAIKACKNVQIVRERFY